MEKLTRRFVLQSTAGLTALLVFSRPSFANNSGSTDFLRLSQFLTTRQKLDETIAQRIYTALTADDPKFSDDADRLYNTIRSENFADMSLFSAFTAKHPDLQSVAMKIISAWYLGYTGTPSMNILKDDARYVSYEKALMYEPTRDATVIPSFSRGRTNYWFTPPSTLATD